MPLPSIIEVAQKHLFSDRDQMLKGGIPELTVGHIERLRDIYMFWVSFPSKRDRDIVAELKHRYGIGETVARQDLRVIKNLLGNIEKVSKDYMRYRVTQMLERAYQKAVEANNPRDMVAAAKALSDAHQLGKEDDRASVLDKVVPVVLSFTDDPTVIGIQRMPDFRNKIRQAKERYFMEQTQDIEFEEIDARIDDIFNPKHLPDGLTAPTSIS